MFQNSCGNTLRYSSCHLNAASSSPFPSWKWKMPASPRLVWMKLGSFSTSMIVGERVTHFLKSVNLYMAPFRFLILCSGNYSMYPTKTKNTKKANENITSTALSTTKSLRKWPANLQLSRLNFHGSFTQAPRQFQEGQGASHRFLAMDSIGIRVSHLVAFATSKRWSTVWFQEITAKPKIRIIEWWMDLF